MSNDGYKLEDAFWKNQYDALKAEKDQDDLVHSAALERWQARCSKLAEELNQLEIDCAMKLCQVSREAFLEGHASASCGKPSGWESSVARQISEGYKRT